MILRIDDIIASSKSAAPGEGCLLVVSVGLRTGFSCFSHDAESGASEDQLPYPVQAKGTHRNQGYTFLFGNSRYHLGWIARTDMIRYPDSGNR